MPGPSRLWQTIPLLSILFFSIAVPVLAAVDFRKCCTQVPVSEELRPLQWDACHSSYNSSETDPAKKWAPEIVTTYAWCVNVCEASGDFQVSDTSEWLSPLTAWIIPASALLFLLPISEHLKSDEQYFRRTKQGKIWEKYVGNWWLPLVEYIQILGDPASAFNGALAQMTADWTLCLSMHKPLNRKREQDLILIVILAEQADFRCAPMRSAIELMAGSSRAREYSKTAGRVIWSARKKFNTSVVLPIALYIGVAAAVFYDAYQKLGDNGTSHSLAYGVWYNWILLLSVFANCFASHSNLDAVRSGMEIILRGVIENHTIVQLSKIGWDNQAAQTLHQSYDTATKSLAPYPAPHPPMLLNPRDLFSRNLECKGVPLHKRYRNTYNWVRWLHKNGVDIARPTKGIWSYRIFWPDWYSTHHPKIMYLVTQLLSWFFVLFSCACAAVLSYTTPKVSLGCRSMNHIIYASIALLNAVTRVVKDTLKESEYVRTYQAVTVFYYMMGSLNTILVLIGGSFLQITGVFRNCWCMSGIVGQNANSTIILSTNTYGHQYWARTVWLRVAYMAYGGVGMCCVVAFFIRRYVAHSVRKSLI
ncbi:hypothetical protein L873DRAFT_1765570 [Choiromyces venosus 120613-1]|uniref:Uncharacterized protein n=1 Tax=Choiromyces venosus 120613-1 TaxID=1336337 RepID=A0A3N4JQY4_9PEZI|nr:hypothetical protein L873DRAFT_1765570 [Choiromyces venosus 120613-1]